MRPQILFLAHRVPYPPNRGDRIRSFHLLKYLAERAEVDLAYLAHEPVPEDTHRVLGDLCRRVTHAELRSPNRWINGVNSLALGKSATEGLFCSGELKRKITSWTQATRFDAVFVFCSSMAQYLNTKELNHVPTVVDLVDVDSQKWFDYADKAWGPKRWLLRLEGRRLRQLERSLPDQVDAITVVTPQEADVFQSFRADYRPRVLRNGVDLDYFKPAGESDSSPLPKRPVEGKGVRSLLPERPDGCFEQKDPDPFSQPTPVNSQTLSAPSVVFVGALDYQANVDGAAWFCSEVWPQIRERYPNARFRLVGSRPSAKAIRLGKLHGVDLVGEVSDVRPYLHEATVVTVPLRVVRGVQNKVLEALAAGKPVVVSPQGVEGIEAEPDRHLVKATTASQWVDAITQLFDSPSQCDALGRAGREFTEQEYRWSSQLEQLCNIPALMNAVTAAAPTAGFPHPVDAK